MTTTLDLDERHLTLPGGRGLRYVTRGPRSERALVFVHGWPDSWRSFEPVLDALPLDIPAVAVSLPGFGGAAAPESGLTPPDFAADVAGLVERLGIASVLIVGHSMGALVALHLAAGRPDLVIGAVLVGGFGQLDADLAGEVAAGLTELDDPIDEDFARSFQQGTLAAPIDEAFFDRLVSESMRVDARVWRAAFDGLRSSPADPSLIGVPVLLIWGERDGLVPRQEQERLAAAMPAASLVVYEGAGHSPNWEQPARVALDIARTWAGLTS